LRYLFNDEPESQAGSCHLRRGGAGYAGQLATHFAAEALEWKAKREAASAALGAESADQAGPNAGAPFLSPPPAHEQIIFMGLDEALAVAMPMDRRLCL